MKHLYFIRHGESTANVINQIGNDEAELTEKGAAQAVKVARQMQLDDINPDVMLVSPLQRAKETAKYIAQEIGFDLASVEIQPILRERQFGSADKKIFSKDIDVTVQQYFKDPLSLEGFDGIETLRQLHARAEATVTLLKNRPEDTVVVVSHGALFRSIYRVLNDIAYDKPVPLLENAKIQKLI